MRDLAYFVLGVGLFLAVSCGLTHLYAAPILPPEHAPRVEAFTLRLRTNTSFCTAVLVGPAVALTAAHCMRESQYASVWSDTRQAGTWVAESQALAVDQALLTLQYALPPPYAKIARGWEQDTWIAGYGCRHTRAGVHVLETRPLRLQRDGGYRGLGCHGDSGSGIWTPEGSLQAIIWGSTPTAVYAFAARW